MSGRSPQPVPKLSRSSEIRASNGHVLTTLDNVDATSFTASPAVPVALSALSRGSTLPAHPLSHFTGRVAIPAQTRASTSPLLDDFNTAPADQAHRTLLGCLHSSRWARRIADHRPYPTTEALLAASDEAAYDLTAADLAEALAGETLPVLPEGTYEAAHTALSAAYAAYEARFGHAFVSCLAGVPRSEALDHVLASIQIRWKNDPEKEQGVAAEELRRLAKQRLSEIL